MENNANNDQIAQAASATLGALNQQKAGVSTPNQKKALSPWLFNGGNPYHTLQALMIARKSHKV